MHPEGDPRRTEERAPLVHHHVRPLRHAGPVQLWRRPRGRDRGAPRRRRGAGGHAVLGAAGRALLRAVFLGRPGPARIQHPGRAHPGHHPEGRAGGGQEVHARALPGGEEEPPQGEQGDGVAFRTWS